MHNNECSGCGQTGQFIYANQYLPKNSEQKEEFKIQSTPSISKSKGPVKSVRYNRISL